MLALLFVWAVAASALRPLGAAAQTSYPQCGSLRPSSGPGDLPMSDASVWSCAGDLQPLDAGVSNGGPASDTTFSSSHEAVPEECPPVGTTCGRGEFGYSGGELPSGSVLLDNVDPATSGDHFACPIWPNATGSSAVVSSTLTTSAAGSATPALLLHAGTFSGGTNDASATTTGDVQCFDPYLTSPSAAMGGTAANGAAYAAACIFYANCLGAGALAALLYLPENSSAGPSCRGRVLAAGGWNGSNDVAIAALYDPRAAINGSATPNNPSFNTWSGLTPIGGYRASMMMARDSALVVQLSSTRWLIAGGETEPNPQIGRAPTSSYEIFDAAACGFLPVVAIMNAPRYDAGAAKFADGTVLICGGVTDFFTHMPISSCDEFAPNPSDTVNGGLWMTAARAPGLSTARSRLFGQFLPGTVTASNPNGNILMAGGNQPNATTSEECSETACGLNITTWDNYCYVPSGIPNAGCNSNAARNDLGYEFDPNGGGIADSSHVLVGYNPAETAPCPVGGAPMCPIPLPGGIPSNTWDGLVLECGGYDAAGNSGGNDTLIGCEYYVPSGVWIPTAFSGRCSTAGPRGPGWCTQPGLHLNRERAYFNLAEVPASNTENDSFFACGGMYGQDSSNFHHYVVRSNCETVGKGNGSPGGSTTTGGEAEGQGLISDAGSIVWSWQGPFNRAQMRDDTGPSEADRFGPHFNWELQPPNGGKDYNNFHLRYLGTRRDAQDGVLKHWFLADDSNTGQWDVFRENAYYGDSYECQDVAQGIAWQMAYWMATFMPSSGPTPMDMMTEKTGTAGNDTSDLLAALQALCDKPPSNPPRSAIADLVGPVAAASPSGARGPSINPPSQSSVSPNAASWLVSVPESPLQATTLDFDYGDNTASVVTVPQGSGTATFSFAHTFGRQGAYNGAVYQQTFIQRGTIIETGGQSYATTAHTCS